MENEEYKSEFELEIAKFKFDKKKYEDDKSVFKKHLPTIITGIISITALLISYIQFRQTELSKNNESTLLRETRDKELAILNAEKDKELTLLKAQKDRADSIELSKFVISNKDLVFSDNINERTIVRNTISIAYPEFAEKLFQKFAETSPKGERKDYWDAATEIEKERKKKSITLHYYANNIPKDTYEETKQILARQGFSEVESMFYENTQDWMEKDCSVIYYDNSNSTIAEELATKLKTKWNKNFKILKGSVFDQIKGKESIELFIHHVNCSN